MYWTPRVTLTVRKSVSDRFGCSIDTCTVTQQEIRLQGSGTQNSRTSVRAPESLCRPSYDGFGHSVATKGCTVIGFGHPKVSSRHLKVSFLLQMNYFWLCRFFLYIFLCLYIPKGFACYCSDTQISSFLDNRWLIVMVSILQDTSWILKVFSMSFCEFLRVLRISQRTNYSIVSGCKLSEL